MPSDGFLYLGGAEDMGQIGLAVSDRASNA